MFGGFTRPIELGGEIIAPPFGEPFAGISEEFTVTIETGFDGGRDAWFPNSEGADSDLDAGVE